MSHILCVVVEALESALTSFISWCLFLASRYLCLQDTSNDCEFSTGRVHYHPIWLTARASSLVSLQDKPLLRAIIRGLRIATINVCYKISDGMHRFLDFTSCIGSRSDSMHKF